MTTESQTPQTASKSGLLAAAGRALRRFPGVLAVAALGTVLVIQAAFQSGDDPVKWAHWRLLLVAALGISWLYSLSLIAERRYRGPARQLLPLGFGFATLGLYYLRLRSWNEATVGEAFLFEYLGLFFALHAFAAYAPYLGRREPRGFWEYNRRIFLRILAALLFSGTLYVGCVVFFAALSRILEFRALGYILVFFAASIVGIFNTWFFLAGVPEDFEALERQPSPYPRGLKAFAQFVLLPLAVAIGLVLELWLIQRLATGGRVDPATAGAFFAWGGFGLLTYLLLYPLREDPGERWLKAFEKGFFLGLLPMLGAVAYAVFRLIQRFGWTPPRYYAVVLSLWGLGLCLYFLLVKRPGIRWIPVSLSLIALFTVSGPQGPYQVSRRSQEARLAASLREAGLAPGAPATEALLALPAATKEGLLGRIGYLESRYGCEGLRPYFGPRLETVDEEGKPRCDLRPLRRILTRDPSLSPEGFVEAEAVAINFLTDFPSYREVSVRGFDLYFPVEAVRFLEGGRPSAECPQGNQESPVCAVLPKEGRQLELYLEGRPLGKIDLEPIYGPLLKTRYETASPAERESPMFRLKPEEMTFDRTLPGGKARLRFDQIRLEKRGAQVYPDYVRFSLLFQKGS
ncbi:DUF4153 domain-containing protein [Deltaproteobacteria bacterium PRO3]|nr:DUF4153 domain-containing protein [Deltaproteobacteria bacterium PRO3]